MPPGPGHCPFGRIRAGLRAGGAILLIRPLDGRCRRVLSPAGRRGRRRRRTVSPRTSRRPPGTGRPGACRPAGRHADADRRGAVRDGPDRLHHPGGDGRRCRQARPGQQHAEFVTAQPGHRVTVADRAAHRLRHRLHRPVAGRVTTGVVDQLELVHVDDQRGDEPAAGIRTAAQVVHGAVEATPVADPGEHVGLGGQRGQLVLHPQRLVRAERRRGLQRAQPLPPQRAGGPVRWPSPAGAGGDRGPGGGQGAVLPGHRPAQLVTGEEGPAGARPVAPIVAKSGPAPPLTPTGCGCRNRRRVDRARPAAGQRRDEITTDQDQAVRSAGISTHSSG